MIPLTVTIKISTVNFEDRYNSAVRKLAERSQQILLQYVREEVISRGMVAERDLLNSLEERAINLEVEPILMQAGTDDIAAAAGEYGTRPSSVVDKRGRRIVNVENIERWLMAKGDTSSKKGSLHQKAYAIALAIGEHGLPLKGGLKRPFAHARLKAKRRIDRMWVEDLPRMISGEIS